MVVGEAAGFFRERGQGLAVDLAVEVGAQACQTPDDGGLFEQVRDSLNARPSEPQPQTFMAWGGEIELLRKVVK